MVQDIHVSQPKKPGISCPDNDNNINFNGGRKLPQEFQLKSDKIDSTPFKHIVGIQFINKEGKFSLGSGLLIGPNLILTSAHNMPQKIQDNKSMLSSYQIFFCLNNEKDIFYTIQDYYVPPLFRYNSKNLIEQIKYDYALIKLKEEVVANDFIGIFKGKLKSSRHEFGISGFPVDKNLIIEGQKNTKLKAFGYFGSGERFQIDPIQGSIRYQGRSRCGYSGGALIQMKNGKSRIIGIHKAKRLHDGMNYATLLTEQIAEKLGTGFKIEQEDETDQVQNNQQTKTETGQSTKTETGQLTKTETDQQSQTKTDLSTITEADQQTVSETKQPQFQPNLSCENNSVNYLSYKFVLCIIMYLMTIQQVNLNTICQKTLTINIQSQNSCFLQANYDDISDLVFRNRVSHFQENNLAHLPFHTLIVFVQQRDVIKYMFSLADLKSAFIINVFQKIGGNFLNPFGNSPSHLKNSMCYFQNIAIFARAIIGKFIINYFYQKQKQEQRFWAIQSFYVVTIRLFDFTIQLV